MESLPPNPNLDLADQALLITERDQRISESSQPTNTSSESRHAAWFHELDAWTEYWDIYHPETRGRFYFGDGAGENGLLTRFLPREHRPPAFNAWRQMATGSGTPDNFRREVRIPEVAAAVMEVDGLVGRLFDKHFGDAADPSVQQDYLEATSGKS